MMDRAITKNRLTESPDMVFGRMKEGAHLAGYSFQRAMENLRWLLVDSKFKQLSPGYEDVNDFLRDCQPAFALLNIKPEERKQIAELVKELQPKSSQRAIADMVGVSEITIARDLGVNRGATNVADKGKESLLFATNVAPALPLEGENWMVKIEWARNEWSEIEELQHLIAIEQEHSKSENKSPAYKMLLVSQCLVHMEERDERVKKYFEVMTSAMKEVAQDDVFPMLEPDLQQKVLDWIDYEANKAAGVI